MPKPVALVILDGWGCNEREEGNSVKQAQTPNFDRLWAEYPHTTLAASGEKVGLPAGQMGNSEVGHLNLGAGRVVYQQLTKISKGIEDGSFFKNQVLLDGIKNCKLNDSPLHLLGLLSDGGVHSDIQHLFGLLELAKKHEREVYVHAFLDGRDVPPDSAKKYIKELEAKFAELEIGKIATVSGRYYAMDRDERWDRTQKAYQALVLGEGKQADSALEAVENSYQEEVYDEFVVPTVIREDGEPVATINDDHSVIFFNFRPDRARQLSRAFVDHDFHGFERQEHPQVCFATMTQYDETLAAPVAYPPEVVDNTLGEVLAEEGLKQLRIAETEKYAHVTFFFNGGVEEPNLNEDRKLIPSPKIATYDEQPEMSAYEVKDELLEILDSKDYDVIVLNFANPDMVGHSGDLEACKEAVEAVDDVLGQVVEKVLAVGGELLVTADHGNAEQMLDYETGNFHTAHTSNPTPLIYVGDREVKAEFATEQALADVAPTILKLLDIEQPAEMTGEALVK
ncbi:2,3-bisphosphoglycerate-independent phosphoglycerate mutase [Fuchsiella alkaliacetigena]|uniref:2,3-bisphosphoglycerate-independent phosphoglycerate mutase n=1 Tax=Fuchsiella alkaliacetigena TaxID=957042 RepID=UPI00200B82B3|nr:2,3-bisphosphoglycerate-independent phosphoglycerate mutase [Fuchsiella alkaliacetigena]MCK8824841.1 2,3-bisphosphoglycerate-independent phosphoglycerate mutase [Fuchsiella alkaliacetigena]